jgi:hypothetical protein
MPTVSIKRDELFERLGKVYTVDEFQNLCFQFGIELDDIVEEDEEGNQVEAGAAAAAGTVKTVYKIEVAANRYDLLCVEGLSRALRVFLELDKAPVRTACDRCCQRQRIVTVSSQVYTAVDPAPGSDMLTMTVERDTAVSWAASARELGDDVVIAENSPVRRLCCP